MTTTQRAHPRSRADLLQRRVDVNAELRTIRGKYASNPNALMTEAETKHAEQLIAERDELEVELERVDGLPAPSKPSYDRTFKIGQEERTYRPDSVQSGGNNFFADLARSQVFRDPSATERLARHQHEMTVDGRPGSQERAIGTGAVTGLVPPAYLAQQYAELARAGRPAADACTKLPLPDQGMTVNISRITTGTSAAIQATEGAGVSETNADDTLLTANVNTIAGQQTVSRQAIERGALVEPVLMSDLAGAHNATLDSQVINGSGRRGSISAC